MVVARHSSYCCYCRIIDLFNTYFNIYHLQHLGDWKVICVSAALNTFLLFGVNVNLPFMLDLHSKNELGEDKRFIHEFPG